jgi:predicted ester cyclase
MKTYILGIILIFISSLSFAQSKKELAAKRDIEELIHREVGAFLEKDWEGFEACWLHEPYSRHFVTSKSAFNGKIGWDNMKDLISRSFEIEGSRGYTTEKTDIDIQVFGKAAYATFKEHYTSTSPDDPLDIEALNNAFFINQNGEWKFVCMNIVNTSSFIEANRNRDLVQEYLETISGHAKTRAMFAEYISDESLIRQNLAVEQAFPIYELSADEILVDGKRVVAIGNFRGIQHGTYGDIAPTGNEVKLPVVMMFTVQHGKISEYRVSYDNASMLRQLGAYD